MRLETTYRRSVEFWKVTVLEVSDDWSKPTPCSEWNVRALVNHVVSEDRWTKPLVEGMTIAEVGMHSRVICLARTRREQRGPQPTKP